MTFDELVARYAQKAAEQAFEASWHHEVWGHLPTDFPNSLNCDREHIETEKRGLQSILGD